MDAGAKLYDCNDLIGHRGGLGSIGAISELSLVALQRHKERMVAGRGWNKWATGLYNDEINEDESSPLIDSHGRFKTTISELIPIVSPREDLDPLLHSLLWTDGYTRDIAFPLFYP